MPDPKLVEFEGKTIEFPPDASEAEISAALGAIPRVNAPNAPKAKTWSRIGIATSVLTPELEAARAKMNSSTELGPEQAIMARSRTGALYPSSIGTPTNAMKGFTRGAGNAAIDIAEGATSPIGLAVAAAPFAPAAAKGIVKGAASVADVVSPEVVGIVSPKIANALRVAQRMVNAAQAAQPVAAGTEKLSLKAMDVIRIKSLIDQGIPQGEAVKAIMNLRAMGKL